MFQRLASPEGSARHCAAAGSMGLIRWLGPFTPIVPLVPSAPFMPITPTASTARRKDPAGRTGRGARPTEAAGATAVVRHDLGLDDADPMTQMALADAADASLMRLVLCAAGATLALALATSLV